MIIYLEQKKIKNKGLPLGEKIIQSFIIIFEKIKIREKDFPCFISQKKVILRNGTMQFSNLQIMPKMGKFATHFPIFQTTISTPGDYSHIQLTGRIAISIKRNP